MTLDEQIALLQGVKEGRTLQIHRGSGLSKGNWVDMKIGTDLSITFHFGEKYRLKPEPRRCHVMWRKDYPALIMDKATCTYSGEGEVIEMVEVLP